MFQKMLQGGSGGSGTKIEVKNATNSSTIQSFPAEVGKHYIVFTSRHRDKGTVAKPGISNGATIIETIFDETANTNKLRMLVAEIVATNTTVTFEGSRNLAYYIEL